MPDENDHIANCSTLGYISQASNMSIIDYPHHEIHHDIQPGPQAEHFSMVMGRRVNDMAGISVHTLNPDVEDVFDQMEPRAYPKMEMEETHSNSVITMPNTLIPVAPCSPEDPVMMKVYNAVNRAAIFKLNNCRDIYTLGLHRVAPFFNLERKLQYDKDHYSRLTIIHQLVPVCTWGQFGLDIETLEQCDTCKSWDDCCEEKGIYEKQEEICKKDYRYIVDIVLSRLMMSSGTKTLFNPSNLL